MAEDTNASSTEESIKRLLELKSIPETKRTQKQEQEMAKLSQKHPLYSGLSASEMKKKLDIRPSSVLLVHAPGHSASVASDFETKFGNRPGYQKASSKNGMLTLIVQSDEDASNFLLSQAGKGRKFRVLDAQRRPIATSNGKGIIQLANGQPLRPGQPLRAQPIANSSPSMQQNPRMRPVMTPAQSTILAIRQGKIPPALLVIKPKVNPPLKPPASRPVIKKEPEEPVSEIQHRSNSPTPFKFKKTPFDF